MSQNPSSSATDQGDDQGEEQAGPVESGLLDAVLALAGDLELGEVLDRIVRSARTLTSARYAALGVVGVDAEGRRQLTRFHHVGMSPEVVAAIPHLPEGRGVLGVLLDDPRPLRLDDLGDHPAAGGFPPGHARMRTFLGVPVRVRGEIFGNLYLADKAPGPGPDVTSFSVDDERLVLGLAAAAGVVVENARLFAESQLRQRWLAASARVVPLVSADLATAPQAIADAAWTAAGCSWVGVGLPTTEVDGELEQPGQLQRVDYQLTATAGPDGPEFAGRTFAAPDRPTVAVSADGWRLVVGCRVRNKPLGVLVLHRRDPGWSADEIELVHSFADHVALAAERALDEHDRRRLAVYTDRDRIARDLHDHVIQRIFAVGLSLQSTLRSAPDSRVRSRVNSAVADLDATIAEIRNSIFSLQHVADASTRSLRAELLDVVDDATTMLGFEPRVTLVGPIDAAVPDRLRRDVLATVRESLTNVARHAHADDVSLLVSVDAAAKTLVVQVEDNGVGISENATPRGGLHNTADRAAAAGGYSTVARRAEPGTTFAWVVPLPV